LVTNGSDEVEIRPFKVEDYRKGACHGARIYEIYPNFMKEMASLLTHNRPNLQKRGFHPIVPKNLPDRCSSIPGRVSIDQQCTHSFNCATSLSYIDCHSHRNEIKGMGSSLAAKPMAVHCMLETCGIWMQLVVKLQLQSTSIVL
jgi:hypothetical protein